MAQDTGAARQLLRRIAKFSTLQCGSYGPHEANGHDMPADERAKKFRACVDKMPEILRTQLRDTQGQLAEIASRRLARQISSPDVKSWFEHHRWCPKCNLFGGTPCEFHYVLFNEYSHWRRNLLGWSELQSPPVAVDSASAYTVFEAVEIGILELLSECAGNFSQEIFTEERFNEAEKLSDNEIERLKKASDKELLKAQETSAQLDWPLFTPIADTFHRAETTKQLKRDHVPTQTSLESIPNSLEQTQAGNDASSGPKTIVNSSALAQLYRNVASQTVENNGPPGAYSRLLDAIITAAILEPSSFADLEAATAKCTNSADTAFATIKRMSEEPLIETELR